MPPTAELIRLAVEFLLAGGGLLALLRFFRDRRKDSVEVDSTSVQNAEEASNIIKEILREVRSDLAAERARNKELRDELDAERRANADLRKDVANLTQQLAEAVSLAELNRAQFTRVQEELQAIRLRYGIED